MSTLRVLDGTGDTRISWDKDKKTEIEAAQKMFKELKAKGYNAFGVKDSGKRKHKILEEFDADLEEIIMVPKIVGG